MDRSRAKTCTSCGALNKAAWEYCARCGDALPAAAAKAKASKPRAAAREAQRPSGGVPWFALVGAGALVLASVVGWRMMRSPPTRPDSSIFSAGRTQASPPAAVAGQKQPGGSAAYEEGRRLLAEGKVQEALQLLRQATTEAPGVAAYWSAYGLALWRDGQKAEAIQAHRAAVEATDSRANRVVLARALAGSGDVDSAAEEFKAALARGTADPALLDEVSLFLLANGRGKDALPLLEQAVQLNPNNARAKRDLAMQLEKEGKGGESAKLLAEVLEKSPGAVMTRGMLADSLLRDGKTDEAIELLRAGLPHSPKNAFIHAKLGGTLESAGRPAEAAAVYREFARQAPDSSDAAWMLTRAAKLEGQAAKTSS